MAGRVEQLQTGSFDSLSRCGRPADNTCFQHSRSRQTVTTRQITRLCDGDHVCHAWEHAVVTSKQRN
jgi:hypothetical protein